MLYLKNSKLTCQNISYFYSLTSSKMFVLPRVGLLAALAALPLATLAQTTKPATPKSTARPTAKPAPKPIAKPVAKPAAKPTPSSAPVVVAPTPAARPAATAAEAFEVGTKVLNLGVGFGTPYSYGAGLFGGSSSVSPALSLSYEQGILTLGPGMLGVGALLGYEGANYDFVGDKYTYRDFVLMARGAFHYPVAPAFDAYGGLGVGVRYLRASYDGGSSSATSGTAGLFLGGRYFFTPAIGAFAEVGYDASFIKVGLSAKF